MALLVWQDGKVIYERYFGDYDPHTQVAIASASKWLSAATVMTLVDEGRLDLDARITQYLPGFAGAKAEMTIRQMFSHASGLVDFPGEWDYSTTPMAYAQAIAREGRMAASPGTEIRHASASMQVVGAIAEQISGRSCNDLFLDRITRFASAHCADISTFGPVSPVLRLVKGAWNARREAGKAP